MTPADRESFPLAFGGTGLVAANEETAAALVDAAWRGGVRMFDSAPFYGHGLCETRLGAALAHHKGARVIAKVGIRLHTQPIAETNALRDLWPANGPFHSAPGFRTDEILACFSESCGRLGVEAVDIALLHGLTVFPAEYKAHRSDAIGGLEALRATARARRIGVAVNSVPAAFEALDGWKPDVLLLANALSLTAKEPVRALLDHCNSHGIAILAAAPFGGGALFRGGEPAFDELCARHSIDGLAAALQYPL